RATLLTMNPGVSDASTVVLPHESTSARAEAVTLGLVARPGTISTSGNTVGGLKKWIPTIRSGCLQPLAIAVIESDDVFVARTASSATTDSSRAKRDRFTSSFSTTASMMRAQSRKS